MHVSVCVCVWVWKRTRALKCIAALLATRLSFPQILIFFFLSPFFSFAFLQQDCPNGRLTPAKFVDMYKMFFPSGNAEEFCDHVFRTFDMDKNGYIDFKVSNLSG